MFSSGLDVSPLADAVRDGRSDVADVAREVGASAAQLGVPLHEVMWHVERAHAGREPSFATTRAAALAWAERALVLHADLRCEDPLTSLATLPHVRSRLAEIYRRADREGTHVADTTALVVVELPRAHAGHELEVALRALDVAEAMRGVFRGDEIVAQLSSRRFSALVLRERADVLTLIVLRAVLEVALEGVRPRLWVEHLPSSDDGVAQMLAELSE